MCIYTGGGPPWPPGVVYSMHLLVPQALLLSLSANPAPPPPPLRGPADSQRLFDLVRCKDERVRLAFWFALRNTLVTADLDTASRIAYGTPFKKVVTLTGQLIAESGTMSGGGGRPRGGKMRLGSAAPAGVAADAKALEKELAAAEKQLQQLEGQLRAARDARWAGSYRRVQHLMPWAMHTLDAAELVTRVVLDDWLCWHAQTSWLA